MPSSTLTTHFLSCDIALLDAAVRKLSTSDRADADVVSSAVASAFRPVLDDTVSVGCALDAPSSPSPPHEMAAWLKRAAACACIPSGADVRTLTRWLAVPARQVVVVTAVDERIVGICDGADDAVVDPKEHPNVIHTVLLTIVRALPGAVCNDSEDDDCEWQENQYMEYVMYLLMRDYETRYSN